MNFILQFLQCRYCETGGIMRQLRVRQHKFCPNKQKYNNVKSFPVYVLANEKVENYYKCFKCGPRTWNMNLMFLHQNDSLALLGKVYLKIGMHVNFYFIAAS